LTRTTRRNKVTDHGNLCRRILRDGSYLDSLIAGKETKLPTVWASGEHRVNRAAALCATPMDAQKSSAPITGQLYVCIDRK